LIAKQESSEVEARSLKVTAPFFEGCLDCAVINAATSRLPFLSSPRGFCRVYLCLRFISILFHRALDCDFVDRCKARFEIRSISNPNAWCKRPQVFVYDNLAAIVVGGACMRDEAIETAIDVAKKLFGHQRLRSTIT
jgi:hypothetical protein